MHPSERPWPDPDDPGFALLNSFWDREMDVWINPDGRLAAGPADKLTREDHIALAVLGPAAIDWLHNADRRVTAGCNGFHA